MKDSYRKIYKRLGKRTTNRIVVVKYRKIKKIKKMDIDELFFWCV
jgi:hypothetical protein